MARLPRRTRILLRFKWAFRRLLISAPGYVAVRLAGYRFERQGLSGLWEPAFSGRPRDPMRADRRLKWHGWGVLAEPGGYRAFTPTCRTFELYPEPYYAWQVLVDRYARGTRTMVRWEPLVVAARATGPASPQGNSGKDK